MNDDIFIAVAIVALVIAGAYIALAWIRLFMIRQTARMFEEIDRR